MGEKNEELGLSLGLGLSLSLGCGGNLSSGKMNPMHKPSRLVQNHSPKGPWNEMFQFPGKLLKVVLSIFYNMFFFFFFKLKIWKIFKIDAVIAGLAFLFSEYNSMLVR